MGPEERCGEGAGLVLIDRTNRTLLLSWIARHADRQHSPVWCIVGGRMGVKLFAGVAGEKKEKSAGDNKSDTTYAKNDNKKTSDFAVPGMRMHTQYKGIKGRRARQNNGISCLRPRL